MDWIINIRATAIAEAKRDEAQGEDWQLAQRCRYWRWAVHTARQKDNRRTVKALTWIPGTGFRTRGGPVKRWHDDLDAFFCGKLVQAREQWTTAAQNRLFGRVLNKILHKTHCSKQVQRMMQRICENLESLSRPACRGANCCTDLLPLPLPT